LQDLLRKQEFTEIRLYLSSARRLRRTILLASESDCESSTQDACSDPLHSPSVSSDRQHKKRIKQLSLRNSESMVRALNPNAIMSADYRSELGKREWLQKWSGIMNSKTKYIALSLVGHKVEQRKTSASVELPLTGKLLNHEQRTDIDMLGAGNIFMDTIRT
jgi:hypothetical protein